MAYRVQLDNRLKRADLALLVPCYNADRYIEELGKNINELRSNCEFDVIFMDDGSKVPLTNIIRDEISCVILRSNENIGLVRTLNAGIRWALDEGYMFLARQDADDKSLPQRFSRQIELLRAEETVLCVSGCRIVDEDGRVIMNRYVPSEKRRIKRSVYIRNPFAHSSFMFNLRNIERLGLYDEARVRSQDYELIFRAVRNNVLSVCDEILVEYKMSSDNISSKRFYQAVDDLKIAWAYRELNIWSMLGLVKKTLLLVIPRRELTWLQRVILK